MTLFYVLLWELFIILLNSFKWLIEFDMTGKSMKIIKKDI